MKVILTADHTKLSINGDGRHAYELARGLQALSDVARIFEL
jgi:hypothetical protein